jgi:hypothetical protein
MSEAASAAGAPLSISIEWWACLRADDGLSQRRVAEREVSEGRSGLLLGGGRAAKGEEHHEGEHRARVGHRLLVVRRVGDQVHDGARGLLLARRGARREHLHEQRERAARQDGLLRIRRVKREVHERASRLRDAALERCGELGDAARAHGRVRAVLAKAEEEECRGSTRGDTVWSARLAAARDAQQAEQRLDRARLDDRRLVLVVPVGEVSQAAGGVLLRGHGAGAEEGQERTEDARADHLGLVRLGGGQVHQRTRRLLLCPTWALRCQAA